MNKKVTLDETTKRIIDTRYETTELLIRTYVKEMKSHLERGKEVPEYLTEEIRETSKSLIKELKVIPEEDEYRWEKCYRISCVCTMIVDEKIAEMCVEMLKEEEES